jgi:hypothetical protein
MTMLSVDLISYDESSSIPGDGQGRILPENTKYFDTPREQVGKGIFFCAPPPSELANDEAEGKEEKKESVYEAFHWNRFLGWWEEKRGQGHTFLWGKRT